MKKILVIMSLLAAVIVAQAQTTPSPLPRVSNAPSPQQIQDAVAVADAQVVALDAQFAVDQARHTAQRNSLIAQRTKIQAMLSTNAPTINSNPSSQTPVQ